MRGRAQRRPCPWTQSRHAQHSGDWRSERERAWVGMGTRERLLQSREEGGKGAARCKPRSPRARGRSRSPPSDARGLTDGQGAPAGYWGTGGRHGTVAFEGYACAGARRGRLRPRQGQQRAWVSVQSLCAYLMLTLRPIDRCGKTGPVKPDVQRVSNGRRCLIGHRLLPPSCDGAWPLKHGTVPCGAAYQLCAALRFWRFTTTPSSCAGGRGSRVRTGTERARDTSRCEWASGVGDLPRRSLSLMSCGVGPLLLCDSGLGLARPAPQAVLFGQNRPGRPCMGRWPGTRPTAGQAFTGPVSGGPFAHLFYYQLDTCSLFTYTLCS